MVAFDLNATADRRWIESLSKDIADFVFARASAKFSPVRFVQVGAYDGVQNDAIYEFVRRFNWVGALVEPVPHCFKRLKQNYRDQPGLSFHQCCCDLEVGVRRFYMIRNIEHPLHGWWLQQLSSFDKETILRHSNDFPELPGCIEEAEIETVRVDTILERSGMKALDVFVVDTEGIDDRVIYSLAFDLYSPAIVYCEHIHLPPVRLSSLDSFFEARGYSQLRLFTDTIYMASGWLEPYELALLHQLAKAIDSPGTWTELVKRRPLA